MKIGIFASDEIGLKIVSLFAERDIEVACLVLDRQEKEDLNIRIQKISNSKHVFFSEDLQRRETLDFLKSLSIDLVILAWWPYIIKETLFDISRMGFLNTHPSLLPYNRGKHYYFWNLVEDVPFGVTLHWVDKNIDSGDIAFQSKLEKSWEDTGFSLRERSREGIIALFEKNITAIISGKIPRIKQDLEKGSFHLGKEIENFSEIDLEKNYSGKELINLVRGRSGFTAGGTWFKVGNQKYEVTLLIKEVENG
jgi:methionyl-tRNA formyltransferase